MIKLDTILGGVEHVSFGQGREQVSWPGWWTPLDILFWYFVQFWLHLRMNSTGVRVDLLGSWGKKKKNISTDVLRTVRTRGWWSALSNCYWSLLMRWIQGWALIFGICQSCFAAMSVLDCAPCWSALCPARLRPQWTSDLPCHWAIADTTNHHRYSWPLLLPSTAFHFSLGLLAVSVLGCHQDRGRCFWCQDRRETSPLVYILYTCHFI